jgi:hypothetical protein
MKSHRTSDSLNMSTTVFPQAFGSQEETKIHDMLGNSDVVCVLL